MTIYYLLYAWIALLSLLLYTGKVEYEKAKKWFCGLSFLSLLLLFGLRHPSMGIDLQYGTPHGYLGKFVWIADASWDQIRADYATCYYETGYILFNKFLALFSTDYQVLLFSCAALSLLPAGYMIYKESKQPDLSLYIFMGLPTFVMLFSGLRQAIAVGICALALYWVIRKKLPAFLLTVALAMTFHKSAAIFFVAYPVYHFKMNKPLRLATFALPLLVYIFRHPIFALAGKVYEAYAVPDYNNSYRLFVVFFAIYLFCCVFSEENAKTSGLKNLYLVAVCVQAMSGMHSVVMRMGFYYMTPLVLLLPQVLCGMKNRKQAVFFKAAISVCFIAFGLYCIFTENWTKTVPYSFFWA